LARQPPRHTGKVQATSLKREIEVKLRVEDLPGLRRKLRALGAWVGKRLFESNQLFDTPDKQLRRCDELLRVRVSGGACLVTFKGPSLRGMTGGTRKYKVREETEFPVSGRKQASEIIRAMGLVESFRYEKYRTEIRLPGASRVHICLDQTPIGAFLEIEGPPRSIDAAARRLGYGPSDYVTMSYLALWAAHCRRHGLPVGHFLFRKETKSRKTSVLR